jgi:hypothetical protein
VPVDLGLRSRAILHACWASLLGGGPLSDASSTCSSWFSPNADASASSAVDAFVPLSKTLSICFCFPNSFLLLLLLAAAGAGAGLLLALLPPPPPALLLSSCAATRSATSCWCCFSLSGGWFFAPRPSETLAPSEPLTIVAQYLRERKVLVPPQ